MRTSHAALAATALLAMASRQIAADGAPLMPDVRAYGAMCDGITDDRDALTAAAAATRGRALHWPEGATCHTSGGLTLSGGVFYSEASPLQNPPGAGGRGGAVIKCDAGVSPCLTMTGGDATSGAPVLRGVAVNTDGTVPGQIGILIRDTYNAVLEHVMVYGTAVGIKLKATGAAGISAKFYDVETCRITENDVVDDSWPELRINMMRFGCNGDGVTRSSAYLLITGGGPGPNTLVVENSQFNAGGAGAKCFIRVANLGDGQLSGVISEFTFANNHFEAGQAGEAGICSDASVKVIQRLALNGNWFLNAGSGNRFFALDPGTALWNWNIANNHFVGWTGGFTLASTDALRNLQLVGNHFENTPVDIKTVWPSVVQAEPNIFEGLTLSGISYRGVFGGINLGPLDDQSVGVVTRF